MGATGAATAQSVNLANSIIGVGILAMPFCFRQCGVILSILLLIISGFMTRLACHFLLKASIKLRRRNFEVLAFHVFGNAGKYAVEIGIIGYLMGTCIAYFVVIGDLGPQIIAKIFNLNKNDGLRTGVMVVVSVLCVFPLGLLKNIDSLNNISAVTIGFYFCLVFKVIAEATDQMLSQEWEDKFEYWQPAGLLRCLPIFSMALTCQMQLFEIYETLPDASLNKMNLVTKNAVNICTVVYILVGLFGYVGFCNMPITGNIMSSFSNTMLSDIIKLGFVMSLAFSFPLIIFPCRASLYSMLYKKGQVAPHDLHGDMIPDFQFKWITFAIIVSSLLVSLMIPNIEIVLGFIGSTIGVIICVIFPATCFICITVKNTNERMLAQLLLCFGIVIMVLGSYANLQAAEMDSIHHKNDASHLITDKHKFMDRNILPIDKIEDDKVERIIEIEKKADSRLEPPNPVEPVEPIKSAEKVEPVVKFNDEKVQKKHEPHLQMKENQVKEGAGDKEIKPDALENATERKDDDKEAKIKTDEELSNLKKMNLIKTIKRHEQEQREMMMEQQKILKEMKKTRQELEEKKLEDKVSHADVENKKIAAEQIQKLAKIAIESLGITEKPAEKTTKLHRTAEVKEAKPEPKIKPSIVPVVKTEEKPIPETTVKVHMHKVDEPESYKVGENMQLKKDDKKVAAVSRPPILIELAKAKSSPKSVDVVEPSIKPVPVVEKDKNEEYVGGKRDILQTKENNLTERSINASDEKGL